MNSRIGYHPHRRLRLIQPVKPLSCLTLAQPSFCCRVSNTTPYSALPTILYFLPGPLLIFMRALLFLFALTIKWGFLPTRSLNIQPTSSSKSDTLSQLPCEPITRRGKPCPNSQITGYWSEGPFLRLTLFPVTLTMVIAAAWPHTAHVRKSSRSSIQKILFFSFFMFLQAIFLQNNFNYSYLVALIYNGSCFLRILR